MKKLVFISLLFIFTCLFCHAAVVTGGVEYNSEAGITSDTADFGLVKTFLIDNNYYENISALQAGIKELKDRKIGHFSDGTYGIMYYNNPQYSWYYTNDGKLVNFTYRTSVSYPCNIIKYKPDGTIANKGVKLSEKESLIYSPQGKLLAHWKGNLCFDEAGNIIMTRRME